MKPKIVRIQQAFRKAHQVQHCADAPRIAKYTVVFEPTLWTPIPIFSVNRRPSQVGRAGPEFWAGRKPGSVAGEKGMSCHPIVPNFEERGTLVP